MTENELWNYLGKDVLVLKNDGDEVRGFLSSIIPSADNEEAEASIYIDIPKTKHFEEVFSSEIKSIEVI